MARDVSVLEEGEIGSLKPNPEAPRKSTIIAPLPHISSMWSIIDNRYILLAIALYYVILTGPAYFNWSPLRDSLYRAGAYHWYCDPSEDDASASGFITRLDPEGSSIDTMVFICKYQTIAVNRLMSIASYVHFLFAVLAGIISDCCGPKFTALLGITAELVGWIFLGVAKESVQLHIPGAIIMGMGIETSFLPLLSIADLFPKYSSFVVSLLGAARSLSFAIPVMMGLLIRTFTGSLSSRFTAAVMGYVGLGLGSCFIIALLVIPLKPWKAPEGDLSQIEKVELRSDKTRTSFASALGLEDLADLVTGVTQRKYSVISPSLLALREVYGEEGMLSAIDAGGATAYEKKETAEDMVEESQRSTETKETPVESQRSTETKETPVESQRSTETKETPVESQRSTETKETLSQRHTLGRRLSPQVDVEGIPPAIRLSIPDAAPGNRHASFQGGEDEGSGEMLEEAYLEAFKTVKTSAWKDFKRQLLSVKFVVLVIFCMISLARCIFFSVASEALLPNTLSFYGIISIFSFVPAPILGYLSDKIGIVYIMHFCNIVGLAMYACVLIPSIPALIPLQYIAGVLYTVLVSFLLSQIYCFGVAYFSKVNVGKLIGIVVALSGVMCLVVDPVFGESKRAENFYPACFTFVGLSVLNTALLAVVQVRGF